MAPAFTMITHLFSFGLPGFIFPGGLQQTPQNSLMHLEKESHALSCPQIARANRDRKLHVNYSLQDNLQKTCIHALVDHS